VAQGSDIGVTSPASQASVLAFYDQAVVGKSECKAAADGAGNAVSDRASSHPGLFLPLWFSSAV
jgi:hypothetical protein